MDTNTSTHAFTHIHIYHVTRVNANVSAHTLSLMCLVLPNAPVDRERK